MSNTLKNLNLIFPTPIPVYEIEDFARINDTLLEEIAARRQEEQGMVRSNRIGWHSNLDFFARSEPAHYELAQKIMRCLVDATQRIRGTKSLDELRLNCVGWVNVNPRGSYNVPHEHPGAFWSAAYYVKVPIIAEDSEAGAIEFIDSRSMPAGNGLVESPYMQSRYNMRPSPGTLVVFPSTLKHWVHPHDTDEDRITIAINAKLDVDDEKRKQAQLDAAHQSERHGPGATDPGGEQAAPDATPSEKAISA